MYTNYFVMSLYRYQNLNKFNKIMSVHNSGFYTDQLINTFLHKMCVVGENTVYKNMIDKYIHK